MLFHEALHLVFTTFSRQVLQQGCLTNYLADCGVFEPYDEKRTICLLIDQQYGRRLYECLSHSPYKESFDMMVAEIRVAHPEIDTDTLLYVFNSLRFGWGKIRSLKVPQPKMVLPLPVPKKSNTTSRRRLATPQPRIVKPHQQKSRRSVVKKVGHLKRSTPSRRNAVSTYSNHRTSTQGGQVSFLHMVFYICILFYLFCATVTYFTADGWTVLIFVGLAALFLFLRIKFL